MAKKSKSRKNLIKKGYKIRHKPSSQDLVTKIEKICVGQPLKKIPIVLGVSINELAHLLDVNVPIIDLDDRLSMSSFIKIKEPLLNYIENLLKDLPEKQMVTPSKGLSNAKKTNTAYSKLESHKGFINFINTNM